MINYQQRRHKNLAPKLQVLPAKKSLRAISDQFKVHILRKSEIIATAFQLLLNQKQGTSQMKKGQILEKILRFFTILEEATTLKCKLSKKVVTSKAINGKNLRKLNNK